MSTAEHHALTDAARDLAPLIAQASDQIESDRLVPYSLVDQLCDAGFFRISQPREYGGDEVDPLIVFDAIEHLAMADASTAWVIMIISSNPLLLGNSISAAVWEATYGQNPDLRSAGTIAPNGKAIAVDGGYQVSGHWKYGSGAQHCEYLISGCMIWENGRPRMTEAGGPDVRFILHKTEDCQIRTDTWDTTGLRGSGSHDYVIDDLFVPEDYAYVMGQPRHELAGPIYRFPTIAFYQLAAVSLGLARAAIDCIAGVAPQKRRGPHLMSEDPSIQLRVAQARALHGSARAYVKDVLGDVVHTLKQGSDLSAEQRSIFRLAVTHAVDSSVRAVDMMYKVGGGSSIYKSNKLERIFRDIHTASSHIQTDDLTYIKAGRMLMGLPPEDPIFQAGPM